MHLQSPAFLHEFGSRAVRASSIFARRLPQWAVAPVSTFRHVPGGLGAWAAFASTYSALTAGTVPEDLAMVVKRLLAVADRKLAQGRDTSAVEAFDLALQLSFHPTVNHGSELSPLATDPATFLAPYRRSAIGRLMIDSPDPERPERPGGRRVLVVAHGSWTFADRVVAGLRASTDLEITTLDLSTLPPGQRPGHREAVRARFDFARYGKRQPVPPVLAGALERADTVFVEWGTYSLTWLSLMDLPDVRVISRLHRFEALTPYPMLTDFAQVDDMLFVSPAVRDMVASMAPRLEQARRISVVRNPHDYTPFTPRKQAGAERTLVQIGWAIPVKDAIFTLDVLERLRQHDSSWKLLLVGPMPSENPPAREQAFVAELTRRLRKAGDAVEVLGRRDDVPVVLERAGFIVSASRQEGTHESVAEGAAAGCVPVVRDWPESANWGGAGVIYPHEWVVEDTAAAARRILRFAEPRLRELEGAKAAAWVAKNRDPSEVLEPYELAIRGRV